MTNDKLRELLLVDARFHEDGQNSMFLGSESEYIVTYKVVDNKLNGIAKIYNIYGSLIKMIQFKNNMKFGIYQKFHSNGNVAVMGMFKNDVKFGKWYYYDYKGYQNIKQY